MVGCITGQKSLCSANCIDEELEVSRRVLDGDPDSFRVLVERYAGPATRMIRIVTGDSHACEDLAQEAFLAADAKLRTFDPCRSRFSTWLFTILRNEAADDRILANKIAYCQADPQRGDIVLFSPPAGDWRSTCIKRIVAIGGDTVEIRMGEVLVNGRELPRELADADVGVANRSGKNSRGKISIESDGSADYRIFIAETGSLEASNLAETTVPQHSCFVLGDNRSDSLDSRQLGPISYALIHGRADYLYCPAGNWSRFGRLK